MGMALGERGKGSALLALLLCSGCGVATPAVSSEEAASRVPCPDPTTDCTQSNGTGVYTAEGGSAFIDDTLQLMITNFVNTGSGVNFTGRYYSAPQKWWLMLPQAGVVQSADYGGATKLLVKSVNVIDTIPEWVLEDPTTGVITNVIADKLVGLQLHINFPIPPTGKIGMYVIGFNQAVNETGHRMVHKYNMYWRLDQPNATNAQYCHDSTGKPDMVVFEQGLFVNPVNAAVTRDVGTENNVLLSCRLGGPATVWWWGYPYTTTGSYFDAGLQMKRASYCADANHYTKSGTLIHIDDSSGIEDAPINEVEAFWTPTGATCIGTLRHPELATNWDRTCNGVALQPCPTIAEQTALGGTWLADGIR